MFESIILYDIPSKGRCHAWSYNPWKVRLFLNYKKIPYTTEWTEYPDIGPKLKAFGIPPSTDDPPYTIPAIKIGADTYMMDSIAIVQELEKRYPSPPMHLDSERLVKLRSELLQHLTALWPVFLPKVQRHLLNPPSQEYFYRTRSERVGQDLHEWEAAQDRDACFEGMNKALVNLARFLDETDGPFVEGKEPSFADFVIASFIYCIRRIDETDYLRMMEDPQTKPVRDLYEACQPWFQKDD